MFGILDLIYSKIIKERTSKMPRYTTFKRIDNNYDSKEIWICFPGWGMSYSKLKLIGMLPKNVRIIMYQGPESIVGKTPTQTKKSLDLIIADLRKYLELKKIKKINIYGWSTGCLSSINICGKFKIEKIVLISPCFSLGKALYSSIATIENKKIAIENGFKNSYEYDKCLVGYDLKSNWKNFKNSKFKIIYSNYDKYILSKYTKEFINFLELKKVNLNIKKYRYLDHVSLTLYLGLKNNLNSKIIFK